MMRRFVFLLVAMFITLSLPTPIAFGQGTDLAKQVYRSSEGSVFLVQVNDSGGTPIKLGSAFLVAPRILVTNAHVVEGGTPVLAAGTVPTPLRILRVDKQNDLAILAVDKELPSKPLPLASGSVSPGELIFAIGNPEGLERTISQGIVSGLRKDGDRDLLQISSPISHGSSGGPILNAKGEVVGVTVGTIEEGQNLNFAVPIVYVTTILKQNSEAMKAFSQLIAELRERAGKGEMEAMELLGESYELGAGVAQDYAKAAFWFRKAAEHGDAFAQFKLGTCYRDGHGVLLDDAQSALWFRKSAVQGNADAQYMLGYLYQFGKGLPQDDAQAVTWYHKAADQGIDNAQFSLALLYQWGEGVPQDYAQAAIWFQKAAEQGDADAQNYLGDLYAQGKGIQRDFAQAIAWYQRAANQDNANAQYGLGDFYYFGDGVLENKVEAARWFRTAAESGNGDAGVNLGLMYYEGDGVPRDYDEAYFWFYVAAKSNTMRGNLKVLDHAQILGRMNDVATYLTQSAMAQTQERARKWLRDHPKAQERAQE
ncbi:MAG TPA: trypsin-like peptidase domain-containing protein [Ktedonobacteraceae bacterium]